MAALGGLAGCAVDGQSRVGPSPSAATAAAGSMVVDGYFEDWPEQAAVYADGRHYYFRVAVPQTASLQQSDESVLLWLDADNSAQTGMRAQDPIVALDLGVDFEIVFSPSDPTGGNGRGAIVRVYDAAGRAATLTPAEADLVFSPTHASDQFEIRVSRFSGTSSQDPAAAAAAKRLLTGGTVRAMYVLRNAAGKATGWSDLETQTVPAAAAGAEGADGGEARVPEKAPGTVRIVSYNVLRSSPMKNPRPFERIFDVLDPDVVLVQEWEAPNPGTYQAWFAALVPRAEGWHAVGGAGGVGIISRYPVQPLVTEVAADGRPVRFVSGVVETPEGGAVVGSAHLTCCGAMGSPEDQRRLAEARAINDAMAAAMGEAAPAVRVIGGDFNLVGSRAPLETAAEGLGADNGDLAVAQPVVLGGGAQYTWVDPAQPFPAGRLDYVLVGGGRIVRAFVLDTSRLSEQALASMGLDPTDTGTSDHLPLVVDIAPE